MIDLRIAAFQRYPLFDDVPAASQSIVDDMLWCQANAVQLAVFPECYLQGYATDRETIGRRALALQDKSIAELLEHLSIFDTTIILGMIERRGEDFYNSALVISKSKLLGVYSKAHPNEKGFQAGREFPIFNVVDWSFGINICNDANFPETAAKVASQGIGLLCYPLNNMLKAEVADKWRSRSIENLQARALQTGAWIVSSDVVGHYQGLMSYGCTAIIRPDGEMVRRATEQHEDVIMFDLRK